MNEATGGNLITTDDVVTLEIPDILAEEEENELNDLEAQAEKASKTMLEAAYEFGRILKTIKDKEYFRKQRKDKNTPIFEKFEDYVKWRFNRGRTMGYNYIGVFNVMKALEAGSIDPSSLETVSNTIAVSDEVKRLLKTQDIDEAQVENLMNAITVKACRLIIGTAPVDEKGKVLLEKEHIEMVFETINTVVREQTIEIDGQQVPVTIQQLATEDMITNGLKEQIERRRQANFEEYHNRLGNKTEPKEIIKKAPAPEREIKEEDYFVVNCPKHGATTPVSLVNAGFWTFCGCLAIMEEIEVGHQEFVWSQSREEEAPAIEPVEG